MFDLFKDEKTRAQAEIAFPDLVFIREWLKRNAPRDMPGISFHDAHIDVTPGPSMGRRSWDREYASVTFKAGKLQDLASKFIPYAESLGMKATFNNDEITFSIDSDNSIEIMKTLLARDPIEGGMLLRQAARYSTVLAKGKLDSAASTSSSCAMDWDSESQDDEYKPISYLKNMQAASGFDILGEVGYEVGGKNIGVLMTMLDAWAAKHMYHIPKDNPLTTAVLDLKSLPYRIEFDMKCDLTQERASEYKTAFEKIGGRAYISTSYSTRGTNKANFVIDEDNVAAVYDTLANEFPNVAEQAEKKAAAAASLGLPDFK